MTKPYRSIFMHPDWVQVSYMGWVDYWPHPNIRIMTRKVGPFGQIIALSDCDNLNILKSYWHELLVRIGPMNDFMFHDLTHNNEISDYLLSNGLEELNGSKRKLNIDTFLIDLSLDEVTLFANMMPDNRRLVKRAQQNGFTFHQIENADVFAFSAFTNAYDIMATRVGIDPLDIQLIKSILFSGSGKLFGVKKDDEWSCFAMTYEAGDMSIYYRGVSTGKRSDGAGQLIQWGVISALKFAGNRWYDLGDVPDTDSKNGIFLFKRGFGGEYFDLGLEYGRTGWIFSAAQKIKLIMANARK